MATESEPRYVPVEVDEDGYLRVRTVVIELDPIDVIRTFLGQQDPADLANEVITAYPDRDPVEGTLAVLAARAGNLDGGH